MSAAIFAEWFAVSAAAARVVAALYDAGGRIVTREALQTAAGHADLPYCLKLLRTAMEPGAIHYEMHRGFRLTLAGQDDCRAALADAGRRAAA